MKNLPTSPIFKTFGALLFIMATAIVGCKKDDPITPPPPANPQELITTFRISLVDTSGNAANNTSASFRDLDGPGGAVPTIDTLRLKPGVTYAGTLILLDESKTPVDTISNEVKTESLEHRFWFTVGGGAIGRVTVIDNDLDSGTPPLPVGLQIKVRVSAGAAATGTFRGVLKHYHPASIKRSDTNGSLGDTDIDVTFPVKIQ